MESKTSSLWSVYLTAIKSVPYETSADKYKSINKVAQQIVNNNSDYLADQSEEHVKLLLWYNDCSNGLKSFIQVIVGDKLKSVKAITEALKSTDIQIVNKALQVKWFFLPSNWATPKYYKTYILPFVSLKARRKIIKKLSYGLVGDETKAKHFFDAFSDLYGFKNVLPLLWSCQPDFIYDVILEKKLTLTHKTLRMLYRRHPELVLRYLNLGVDTDNNHDANHFKIDLPRHKAFVREILPNHPNEFLKLAPHADISIGEPTLIGRKTIRFLQKYHIHFLINNPKFIVDNCSLNILYNNLSQGVFEKLYINHLPKDYRDFSFPQQILMFKYHPKKKDRYNVMKESFKFKYNMNFVMLDRETDGFPSDGDKIYSLQPGDYLNLLTVEQFEILYGKIFKNMGDKFNVSDKTSFLEYYPKEKRFDLLAKNYKEHYNVDFLKDIHFGFLHSDEVLSIIPANERTKIVKKLMEDTDEMDVSSEKYVKFHKYLSNEALFKLLKSSTKSPCAANRWGVMKNIIDSCKMNNDQDFLFKCLEFYYRNIYSKNTSYLFTMLDYLTEQLKIENLNDQCYTIFYTIFMNEFITKKGFLTDERLVQKLFEGSFHFLFIKIQNQSYNTFNKMLYSMIDMYLEYQVKIRSKPNYALNCPLQIKSKIYKNCLLRLEDKYPSDHEIWQDRNKKLNHLMLLLEELHKFNVKINCGRLLRSEWDDDIPKPFEIGDYPWLRNSLKPKFMLNVQYTERNESFVRILHKFCRPEEREPLNATLSRDEQIQYLPECLKLLRSKSKEEVKRAKIFVRQVNWQTETLLPFVEVCDRKIGQPALEILQLILDGESLSKLLLELIPYKQFKTNTFNVRRKRRHYRFMSFVSTVIRTANSPTTIELLKTLFPPSFENLAIQCVMNYGFRIGKPEALELANILLNEPSKRLKKSGFLLAFEVASYEELNEFIRHFWNQRNQFLIGRLVALKSYREFVSCPNARTFALVATCLDVLKITNSDCVLDVLVNFKSLPKLYAVNYIKMLLTKVETLAGDEFETHGWKEKWVVKILSRLPQDVAVHLTEELILDVLEKYYFQATSIKISKASEVFARSVFNRSRLIKATN